MVIWALSLGGLRTNSHSNKWKQIQWIINEWIRCIHSHPRRRHPLNVRNSAFVLNNLRNTCLIWTLKTLLDSRFTFAVNNTLGGFPTSQDSRFPGHPIRSRQNPQDYQTWALSSIEIFKFFLVFEKNSSQLEGGQSQTTATWRRRQASAATWTRRKEGGERKSVASWRRKSESSKATWIRIFANNQNSQNLACPKVLRKGLSRTRPWMWARIPSIKEAKHLDLADGLIVDTAS